VNGRAGKRRKNKRSRRPIFAQNIPLVLELSMNTTTLIALAEPNRLLIIELLRDGGPLTIGEIAFRLELNQPQTSKHVRVLNEVGLVEVEPVANRRIIKLRPEPFQQRC
jgi:DNA-binding transcriptional ArsR family regulator